MYCKVTSIHASENHEKIEEFLARSGNLFSFFEACDDYLGHELLKKEDTEEYLLVEKWISKEDYEDFISSNQAAFQLLENELQALVSTAKDLGDYTLIQ
ncbi:MAG: antibiotic biosynthesis monooxygenase [Bacteroidota bacterium]